MNESELDLVRKVNQASTRADEAWAAHHDAEERAGKVAHEARVAQMTADGLAQVAREYSRVRSQLREELEQLRGAALAQ